MAKKKPAVERPLPRAFDADREAVPLLAKAKARLSKNFKWTRAQSLYDAAHLAVLLHVFGRDDEVLQICGALAEYQFTGSFHLWSAVEVALALQARLLRGQKAKAEAKKCVARIRAAGFVDERLEGLLLDRNGTLENAIQDNDRRMEQLARVTRALELAFIRELGGSEALPLARVDELWNENLSRLRELVGGK